MAGEGEDKVQRLIPKSGRRLLIVSCHGPRTRVRCPIQGVALEVLAKILFCYYWRYYSADALPGTQNDSGAEPQCKSHPSYSCVARVTLNITPEIYHWIRVVLRR